VTAASALRIAALVSAAALAGCSPASDTKTDNSVAAQASSRTVDHKDPVASAMAAAPASIAQDAAIVTMDAAGKMTTLRAGTNGFTCMPDNPATPGPDPMCMDKNAMEWTAAWVGKKTPPAEQPGVMYMLAGGTDASNTDPYATEPTKGGDWIKTGPHLMIVGSAKALAGYPSGEMPDTAAPYVMWAGTPFAHLMIPVS
jgi:hypothetical protein